MVQELSGSFIPSRAAWDVTHVDIKSPKFIYRNSLLPTPYSLLPLELPLDWVFWLLLGVQFLKLMLLDAVLTIQPIGKDHSPSFVSALT